MNGIQLRRFPNAAELAATAAAAWLDEIDKSSRTGTTHCVALSGGRIASRFFAAAAEEARRRGMSLDGAHFFWADERCVPPGDEESNFRLGHELLFTPLKVSENRIHRIRGEDLPQNAAHLAEAEMRRVTACQISQPVLDLVLLGLGEDGHVASLFPGESEEVISSDAVYRAVLNSPKPPPRRVTLGYQTIAAAQQVWVLASGEGKQAALMKSLAQGVQTPLARVLRRGKHSVVYTDIVVE